MTADALIAEFEKLPDDERQRVISFVSEYRAGAADKKAEIQFADRQEVRAICQRIFVTNEELLRKLAQ